MATADPDDPAPSALSLSQDANEPVLALLAEISASLKDLQGHSARLMSLVDHSQHPTSANERRATRRSSRRNSRRDTRVGSSRRRRRSVNSSSEYSTTYTDSNDRIVETSEEVIVVEEQGRPEGKIRDREGSTSLDRRPVVVGGRRSSRRFVASSQDRLNSRRSDAAVVRTVELRAEDADSKDSTRTTSSSSSVESVELRGYTSVQVKYGDFPEPDICQQMFGDLLGRDEDENSSWLKEKGLVFSRDGRCSFTFDNVSFAKEQHLASVKYQVEKIEDFARDLRKRGGFFFFRESYTGSRSDDNKIYNGTHVFRCKNRMKEALPRLSANGKNFSEEIPEIRPWGEMGDDASLRVVWNKRDEMTRESELMNSVAYGENYVDPCVTYHYKGEPRRVLRETGSGWVTTHQDGTSSPEMTVCLEYKSLHLTAPWRRLCVLTGLSRIPNLVQDNVWQKVPLFSGAGGAISRRSDGDSGIIQDEENAIDDNQFYEECVLEHLDCVQLSFRGRNSLRRFVKFQFSWYEIVPHQMSEKRQYSGRLYRDNVKRSIQLQSFMAVGVWSGGREACFNDDKYWTLVIIAPAFFYHQEGNSNIKDGLDDLIGPLKSLLPTLSKTLFMISSRILTHWKEISDYVEQFTAGQDTFLHEDRHDKLLFDDDNFTRSRQYFWVITSIGEFILIIDDTIRHFDDVSKWVCKGSADKETCDVIRSGLEATKASFERQRSRATTLRDGLFNASAVVESRLSTRLAQNVKLLTYVSIFYLPLAFCAALWAIPNITDPSTRTPFIVAAVLVGLATYLMVFNLDAVVSLGSTTYSGFREKRIQQMAKDYTQDTWQERARGFKRFVPDRGKTKPSEWYILWYWLLHPLGGPRKGTGSDIGGEEYASTSSEVSSSEASSSSIAETPRTKAWKPWLRKLFKKSEKSTEKNGPNTV